MSDDRASKIRRFFKAVDIARKVLVLVHDVCEFLDEHARSFEPLASTLTLYRRLPDRGGATSSV